MSQPVARSASCVAKEVDIIVEFATDLYAKLDRQQTSAGLALASVNRHLGIVTGLLARKRCSRIPESQAESLGRHGKDLWNLCIRVQREGHECPDLSSARLFAFCILELGRAAARRDSASETVYLMRLALALARTCLQGKDTESARMALRKVANYSERLRGASSLDDAGQDTRARMEAENLALRIILSWKENRLDVAEYMLVKVEGLSRRLDLESVSHLAGTLRGIGIRHEAESDLESALKWLRRARRISSSHVGDRGVRLAVLQDLIRVLLLSGTDEDTSEACSLMDEIMLEHVVPSGDEETICRSLIRRIQLTTAKTTGPVMTLDATLDAMHRSLAKPLGPEVAGAAHLLAWNKIGEALSSEAYEIGDAWCATGLHDIFSESEDSTKAIISRKRMLCALKLDDIEKAIAAFRQMPEAGQKDPLSLFLLFKAALMSWRGDLGCWCIESLATLSEEQRVREIMCACICEAQKVGDKLCALEALKAAALRWDSARSAGNCLTAIIRCGLRLIGMMEKEEPVSSSFSEDICILFEIASEKAKNRTKDAYGYEIFTLPELEWFRKTAYNMGITKCTSSSGWEPSHTVRIFNTCLDFIDCYPPDTLEEDTEGLLLMKMRCDFVDAVSLASILRQADDGDQMKLCVGKMRGHVASFGEELQSAKGLTIDATAFDDLRQKMTVLLAVDFEGAISQGK
ncbi:Meiosis protein SPO22/ZIP4 like [Geosmithia morbida]|uniref:Meiosis protein SPO22/ZIP4 like n=1 Tax=Geosmithia morbida TaxID=1094350 RepID=A0A9P5D1D4_9HYPO|nr:Meiosis protein SPO22/ZIP4 like [Geosmithia morbida]KAF4123768.1 Meiosis protein SPO22/ZIP4 like [Geosmithia morbida]